MKIYVQEIKNFKTDYFKRNLNTNCPNNLQSATITHFFYDNLIRYWKENYFHITHNIVVNVCIVAKSCKPINSNRSSFKHARCTLLLIHWRKHSTTH